MTPPAPDPGALLDRLEELGEAATPGPWRWDSEFGEANDTGLALTNDAGEEIVGAYNDHCCSFRDDPHVNDADAALIVAAVNALPDLIRLARDGLALRDGVERLAEEMETVADEVTPDAERHTRTNSSNRRQRGYAAALRHAADRLRAVVADTSGERQ